MLGRSVGLVVRVPVGVPIIKLDLRYLGGKMKKDVINISILFLILCLFYKWIPLFIIVI